MKIRNLVVGLMVLGLVVPGLANTEKKEGPDAKMMETWMKYATPGEGHKFFNHMVGEWEVTTKSWQQPGTKPEITKGSAKGKTIMDGRYLKMKYEGQMMGMPFMGRGIHAYDNYLKKYISVWIDNFGTGMMISYGTLDKSGKVMTETADFDNIFTGAKEKYKTVYTTINADNWLMEMFMISEKGEFKNLEVVHIRKKK